MKLTGAAILVSRGMKFLRAAPAAYSRSPIIDLPETGGNKDRIADEHQRYKAERRHQTFCVLISFVLFVSFVVRYEKPKVCVPAERRRKKSVAQI